MSDQGLPVLALMQCSCAGKRHGRVWLVTCASSMLGCVTLTHMACGTSVRKVLLLLTQCGVCFRAFCCCAGT